SRRCEYGQEIRESLHTRDKEVARQLARQMELDFLSAGRIREIYWPDFQEEFLQWIAPQVRPNTLRGYTTTAKRFSRFFGPRPLKLITPHTITAFLEERHADIHPSTGRHPGPGGIKFDLRCLRRIFAYAVDSSYMAENPVRQRNLNAEA